MKIIGITGTIGAGKGVIVSYLQSRGYEHFAVRDFILEEVRKRGLPEVRDSNVIVANDIRKSHSPSYIVECLYDRAVKSGHDAVIESIRNPGEAVWLKSQPNFKLISVDAPVETRYKRILSRNGSFDNVTFEQFVEHNRREMSSVDPSAQNIEACMAMADIKLINDGTLDELYAKVDEALRDQPPM